MVGVCCICKQDKDARGKLGVLNTVVHIVVVNSDSMKCFIKLGRMCEITFSSDHNLLSLITSTFEKRENANINVGHIYVQFKPTYRLL